MSKHTPGPWSISGIDPRCIVCELFGSTQDNPRMGAVASVWERIGQTDANARLIAAAPELLVACKVSQKALLLDMEHATGDTWTGVQTAYANARTAIAKAEGANP